MYPVMVAGNLYISLILSGISTHFREITLIGVRFYLTNVFYSFIYPSHQKTSYDIRVYGNPMNGNGWIE